MAGTLALGLIALGPLAWGPTADTPSQAAPARQPSTSDAPLPERYLLAGVWGEVLDRQGLDHPTGIALDAGGRVFVAESGGDRVSVWGWSGRAITTWTAAAGGERLVAPADVALDASRGRLYVAESDAGRVQVLDSDTGASIGVRERLGHPVGLAVAADGRLFVADAAAAEIRVLDPEGSALATWRGDAASPLRAPGGLDWADGRLYVADRGSLRIVVLDDTGLPLPDRAIDLAGEARAGKPLDVAVAQGRVHVALEHAVLRLPIGGGAASELAPLEEFVPPDCLRCEQCRELRPIVANHEGVRGVAAVDGLGLAFSYAPDLRAGDRVVVHPERGFPEVFPSWACQPVPARQLYDPFRIDAGETPELAHLLDRSGRSRILDGGGRFFDATRERLAPQGADVAADGDAPYHTAVLTDNQVSFDSLRCFLGCEPAEVEVADARSRQVRDRVGELVPDFRWWHRALAVRGAMATLDAGRARVVLRQGFPCGAIDVPFCTDRNCHRQQACPLNPTDRPLLGAVSLGSPREPFVAYADLAYDPFGTLWVLARGGSVVGLDRFGRDAGTVALDGLGSRSSEALAADATGFYVLGDDGRVSKHSPEGALLAAWHPAADRPDGRFVDLAVAPDGRVLVLDRSGQQVLVYEPSPETAPPPAEPASPACRVELSKVAGPDPVALGARVDVRLGLSLACPPRDLVVAVDGSCAMAGSRLAAARKAALGLVGSLQPEDRVALTTFDDRVGGWRVLAPMTDEVQALEEAAADLPSSCRPVQLFPERRNDARLAEGLRAGRHLLFGPGSRDEARKSLLLLSASTIDRQHIEAGEGRAIEGQRLPRIGDRTHALHEARRLWRLGVEVHAHALGMPDQPLGPPPAPTPDLQSTQPADLGILAAVARPPRAFASADPPEALEGLWTQMAQDWQAANRIDGLVVTDLVPEDMRLLPGSALPPAESVDGGLRWPVGTLLAGGRITLSLAVSPTVSGPAPDESRGRGHMAGRRGSGGSGDLPGAGGARARPDTTPDGHAEPGADRHRDQHAHDRAHAGGERDDHRGDPSAAHRRSYAATTPAIPAHRPPASLQAGGRGPRRGAPARQLLLDAGGQARSGTRVCRGLPELTGAGPGPSGPRALRPE